MDPAPLVVAFSDSPALRETLSVLLESDCRLRFLSPHGIADRDPLCADLALVAMRRPAALLSNLTRRWPALPIVAVDTAETSGAMRHGVPSVSLDPHAIRTAVLQRLSRTPDASLRATACQVADNLHTELAYPFAALRSLCPRGVGDADSPTNAILAPIMREQAAVLGKVIEQMDRFRARPRAIESTPQFAAGLCRALAQPDALAAERGLLCACVIEPDVIGAAGPMAIAPLIATFLRFHLLRRSTVRIADVRATATGLVLRYTARTPSDPPTASWPLLLASLALRPWPWCVRTASDGDQETVCIRPT